MSQELYFGTYIPRYSAQPTGHAAAAACCAENAQAQSRRRPAQGPTTALLHYCTLRSALCTPTSCVLAMIDDWVFVVGKDWIGLDWIGRFSIPFPSLPLLEAMGGVID